MINIILIFLGSGLGAISRYGVSNFIHSLLGREFPYGTLIVNASGSFVMGLLFILILERFVGLAPQLRAFLLIGFLGGYTTFSSFSIETLNLFENGAWVAASLNILLNVVLCISLAWLGVLGGRSL
jgi:fluoride exporter